MTPSDELVRMAADMLLWSKQDSNSFKMFLQYLYSGQRNKFNPERALHFMYEMFSTDDDNFFGMIMGAVVDNKEVNYIDALSNYQVESKTWLIDELSKLDKHENALFIGGWLGISSMWLGRTGVANQITNLDLDADAIKFSDKLNSANFNYKEGIVSDVDNHSLKEYNMIINTSAEHMTDDWFERVPKGCTVAIQTNDFHEITEHINTVNDLESLQKKYKMSEVYYIGVRDCDRYNRFMIIGKK